MSISNQPQFYDVNAFFALKYVENVDYKKRIIQLGQLHQTILNAGYTHLSVNYEKDKPITATRQGSLLSLAGPINFSNRFGIDKLFQAIPFGTDYTEPSPELQKPQPRVYSLSGYIQQTPDFDLIVHTLK